jgi:hypothetical protein
MRKTLGRGEEGLHIAEDVDQPHTLVAACFGLGLLRLRRGESAEAMAMDLTGGFEQCRRELEAL